MMASRRGCGDKCFHVAVCCAVLVLYFPTICQLNEDKCDKIVDNVGFCWLLHPDVPLCKGKESLQKCAENGRSLARLCDDVILEEIDQMVRAYSSMTSLLCQHPELRNGFEDRRPCWITARNCALPMMSFSSVSANHTLCREAVQSMMVCTIHNFMCRDLQENFTTIVYRASACSLYKPETVDTLSPYLPSNKGVVVDYPALGVLVTIATFVLRAA